MVIHKNASIIKQKLPLLKENELQVQKYTWAIIFNFKARYRLIFVVRSKTKKEHQQQREIKFFYKGITRVL